MKRSPGARPVAAFPRASAPDLAARPCARRAAADPAERCAWAPALAAAVRLLERKRTCIGRETRGGRGHSAVRLALSQGAPRKTSRRPCAARSAHRETSREGTQACTTQGAASTQGRRRADARGARKRRTTGRHASGAGALQPTRLRSAPSRPQCRHELARGRCNEQRTALDAAGGRTIGAVAQRDEAVAIPGLHARGPSARGAERQRAGSLQSGRSCKTLPSLSAWPQAPEGRRM